MKYQWWNYFCTVLMWPQTAGGSVPQLSCFCSQSSQSKGCQKVSLLSIVLQKRSLQNESLQTQKSSKEILSEMYCMQKYHQIQISSEVKIPSDVNPFWNKSLQEQFSSKWILSEMNPFKYELYCIQEYYQIQISLEVNPFRYKSLPK